MSDIPGTVENYEDGIVDNFLHSPELGQAKESKRQRLCAGEVLPARVKVLQWARINLLLILTMLGVLVGIGMGFGVRRYKLTEAQLTYFTFPGELFMRVLNVIIIPLIMSSIVVGVAGMDKRVSGKIGLWTLLYYMTTTVLAVITGIIVTLIIRPGVGAIDDSNFQNETSSNQAIIVNAADSILDLLRNLIPDNIFRATFEKYGTTRTVATDASFASRTSNLSAPGYNDTNTIHLKGEYHSGTNLLGIITFSVIFGIFLGRSGMKVETVLKFFVGINNIIMLMVSFIMWTSPVGIAFLLGGRIAALKSPEGMLEKLGPYILTVLLGILIHGLVNLSLIYFITTKRNPFKFIIAIAQALLTAWSTSSSSATLPITFKCIEEKLGIDKRVTRFMLPLGATINMDGSSVYGGILALFIAQVHEIPINFGMILIVCASATATSIGAAAIPNAAIVTITIFLQACGLPVTDIPLLLTVDWMLERKEPREVYPVVIERPSRPNIFSNNFKTTLNNTELHI